MSNSQARRWRIEKTRALLKERKSVGRIAIELGVGSSTVKGYIKEAKHLDMLEKEQEKEKRRIEKEQEN
jgi:predicted transcriptional regulator